jgi:hypothetical protein
MPLEFPVRELRSLHGALRGSAPNNSGKSAWNQYLQSPNKSHLLCADCDNDESPFVAIIDFLQCLHTTHEFFGLETWLGMT